MKFISTLQLLPLHIVAIQAASSGTSCSLTESVIQEIKSAQIAFDPSSISHLVASAVRDFDTAIGHSIDDGSEGLVKDGKSPGLRGYSFFTGLAKSATFLNEFWHKKPLLLGADDTANWIENSFTVERDLKLVEGSYISGHRTSDVLRNGTRTDTWLFSSLKDDVARKTTWAEVEDALNGGTIYFNNAGSLWPGIGALCRMCIDAFGIPSNVNVYVTPNGVNVSVPPHTDRQDVLVMQTTGEKHWKVYAPPKRSKGKSDALARGKNGDVLDEDELGEPLLDIILRKGDVLYIPTGYPHTTDTIDTEKNDEVPSTEDTDYSVHLTMGLDTHVWALTYAHLRWSVLQKSGENYRLDIDNDDHYWRAMETLPIGFVGGSKGRDHLSNILKDGSIDSEYILFVREELKRKMLMLESERWASGYPSDVIFDSVIEYVLVKHLRSIIDIHFEMFTNVDPQSDDSIIKAYYSKQRMDKEMELYRKFSSYAT